MRDLVLNGFFAASQLAVGYWPAMLSKRQRPDDPDNYDSEQRLGRNFVDLFGGGQVSGARSQSLVNDAVRGGVNALTCPWKLILMKHEQAGNGNIS